jgi:4-hydroxymandelate oxidase
MTQPDSFVELLDFEAAAKQNLDRMAYDYYVSGANDQITVGENRAAFDRLRLLPRMLVNVASPDTTTRVLGQAMATPLMIAPTAFQRMAHPDGEEATARAAGRLKLGMTVSTIASTRLEDVSAAAFSQDADATMWYQLYVYKDREVTRSLVARAEGAGYQALVLTVDTPQFGRRYADVRNQFHLPPGIKVANFAEYGMAALGEVEGESGLYAYANSLFDASLTWADLDWLRSITRLPVLVKGVMRADDARRAVEHGVSGIIVSNHGGRQLDTVPATISVLPAIVEAVDGAVDVLLDGGVRRGTDILKAVALGAKAVCVGRPVLWGLAVGGQAGVERALTLLLDELVLAMKLAGCARIADITRDLIA